MIAEIGSLISSSKTAYVIAKGIYSLKSDVDRNESISKIIDILVSVQTNALSVNAIAQKLQEEKRHLEQKIVEFEKWSETESQYELKEIATGVFVYCCKPTDKTSEPMHWLCANCYNKRQKSILQRRTHGPGGIHYICNTCNSNFIDHSKPLILQDDYPENNGIPIT